jgi:hypothetical protein
LTRFIVDLAVLSYTLPDNIDAHPLRGAVEEKQEQVKFRVMALSVVL